MKKKSNLIPFSALILAGTISLTGCSGQTGSETAVIPMTNPQTASAAQNSITVNSREQVSVIPDIAKVVYSVQTQAADSAGCQKKNAEDVNKVLELLKSLNIQDTSIQTSDYNMRPIYDYSNNTEKVTGYKATTTLTVSGLPLDNLGDFLTQSVSTGINTVESVSYESSKYDEAYQEALKLAVASAYSKATTLAEAGNCKVGNVMNIQEISNYTEARYADNALESVMNTKQATMEDSASLEIMSGQIDVEVVISVQYQIQ